MKPLEYIEKGDIVPIDSWMYGYEIGKDWKKKLRYSNILLKMLEFQKADNEFFDFFDEIIDKIGRNKVVGALKKGGEKYFFEFYFYNYKDILDDGSKQISSNEIIRRVIGKFFDTNVSISEEMPYSMFSVEIESMRKEKIGEFDLYSKINDEKLCSYEIKECGKAMELKTVQELFMGKDKEKKIVSKMKQSIFSGPQKNWKDVIIPEFMKNSSSVFYANKKNCDGCYYSNLKVKYLIIFMKKFGFEKKLINFIENNKDSFDHLNFLVGINFKYNKKKKKIDILKSAVYGLI